MRCTHKNFLFWWLCLLLGGLFLKTLLVSAAANDTDSKKLIILDGDFPILPGSAGLLYRAVHDSEAAAVLIRLNTPGGILTTSQEMVQEIFSAPIPVFVYVEPSGAMAASAGVFITMAGHVAGMAPGTSIGAAHPVSGTGQDLAKDMRDKAQNMASAMARAIAEQRGRDPVWAEDAVLKSSSLTDQEAVNKKVVDFVAVSIDDFLRQAAGRVVTVAGRQKELPDFRGIPRESWGLSTRESALNVLCDPNVAAILWMVASAGIALEFYHPGLIFPGVIGLICLILGLMVNQVLPVNTGASALLVVGGFLIVSEMYVGHGVLALCGILSAGLGAFWFLDANLAPGMSVSPWLFLPVLLILLGFVTWVAREVLSSRARKPALSLEGFSGVAVEDFKLGAGRIEVRGEIWNAHVASGIVIKGEVLRVVGREEGLFLRVEKLSSGSQNPSVLS